MLPNIPKLNFGVIQKRILSSHLLKHLCSQEDNRAFLKDLQFTANWTNLAFSSIHKGAQFTRSLGV